MSKKNKREKSRERFCTITHHYLCSHKVRQMNRYIQHGTTTTLEHCENVAWLCFRANEVLGFHADEKTLVQAALLHDFFLYDWHDGKPQRRTHGFDHPKIAKENAVRYFQVTPKVQESIRSHMWPLTIRDIPRSREAVIICLVDKYCAILETFGYSSSR